MTQSATAVDRDLLSAVLDCLIPAAGGFPGGGSAATEHVYGALTTDAVGRALLQEIDARSRKIFGSGFTALPADQQIDVLRAVEATEPAAFNAVLVHAYGGYYSHPAVVQALGLPAGPPAVRPHAMEPLEPRRLDRVAARGAIYKPV